MSELERLFHSGRIQETLTAWDRRRQKHVPKDCVAAIGAYGFAGRLELAQVIFDKNKKHLSADARVEARFYLAIGWIRISDYAKARIEIRSMRTECAKRPSRKTLYFTNQAVAFFNYFRGDMREVVRGAETALKLALSLDFLFGEILARDLLGQALIFDGEVIRGLRELEKAKDLARRLGNSTFVGAIHVSLIHYSARFGHLPHPVTDLKNAISELQPSDTYSRTLLRLELARQLLLRGKANAAERELEASAEEIHRYGHKRHSATLHFRYAALIKSRGLSQQALMLLNLAAQSVDRSIDAAIWNRINGLRLKLARELGHPEEDAALPNGDFVHRRIIARSKGQTSTHGLGEDLIGDAIDRIRSAEPIEARKLIVQYELWGLLPEILELDARVPTLIVDLAPRSLTACHAGEVWHNSRAMSDLLRKLISRLEMGPAVKSDLIQTVWRYQYDPLRHDPLVHGLVAKLRRILGPFASWLAVEEGNYRFASQLRVVWLGARDLGEVRLEQAFKNVNIFDSSLNYRQIQLLTSPPSSAWFSISNYREWFQVSNMTAFRDLSDLVRRKKLIRRGHGRATRYLIKAREI